MRPRIASCHGHCLKHSRLSLSPSHLMYDNTSALLPPVLVFLTSCNVSVVSIYHTTICPRCNCSFRWWSTLSSIAIICNCSYLLGTHLNPALSMFPSLFWKIVHLSTLWFPCQSWIPSCLSKRYTFPEVHRTNRWSVLGASRAHLNKM